MKNPGLAVGLWWELRFQKAISSDSNFWGLNYLQPGWKRNRYN